MTLTLAPGVDGWQVEVPAGDGPTGNWEIQFHVSGTYADGSATRDIASPVYTFTWETGSVGVTATLDSAGTGEADWAAPVIVGG